MTDHEYDVITPPPVFRALTVVPAENDPEYREYYIPRDDLPEFLQQIDDPTHAEQVVDVSLGEYQS